MPTLAIKSGTTAIAGSVVKGSFSYFSGSTKDLGPTSSTGFYSGVDAPDNGYTVYQIGGSGGWTARVATDTTSLNSILIAAGGTGSTVAQNITWATNTNSVFVNSGATITYTVGQSALGGTIGYILRPGDTGYDADVQHGFVVTSGNTALSVPWADISSYCAFNSVGGTSRNIGAGATNTALIIAACTGTTAASRCVAVRDGGYSDWYLPSGGELDKINGAFGLPSGYNFVSGRFYWTSSEYSSGSAWTTLWNGPNGGFWTAGKYGSGSIDGYALRAVRSF